MSLIIIARTKDENLRIAGTAKKSVSGVTTILDLDTEVTAMVLLYRRPDKTTDSVIPIITNAGTGDGTFHFDTVDAFFTGQKQGYWHFQFQATLTDGKIKHSDIVRILVGEVIGE